MKIMGRKQYHRLYSILNDLGDWLAIAGGIILLLLLEYFTDSRIQTLIEALGTGFVAAGIVSFFLRKLKFGPEVRSRLEILAISRSDMSNSEKNKKYNAKKVDLLGVTLGEMLREIVKNDRMLERVLLEDTRLTIVFVHPEAEFLKQRAFEDSYSEMKMKENQLVAIENTLRIYCRLNELYHLHNSRGVKLQLTGQGLTIKLIDFCPYVTIDRVDDEMRWGLYTSTKPGVRSPIFTVTRKDKEDEDTKIFDHLHEHFQKCRDMPLRYVASGEDGWLVKYVPGNPPELNKTLICNLLTPKRFQNVVDELNCAHAIEAKGWFDAHAQTAGPVEMEAPKGN